MSIYQSLRMAAEAPTDAIADEIEQSRGSFGAALILLGLLLFLSVIVTLVAYIVAVIGSGADSPPSGVIVFGMGAVVWFPFAICGIVFGTILIAVGKVIEHLRKIERASVEILRCTGRLAAQGRAEIERRIDQPPN